MFHCEKCGSCCRHIDLSPLYQELDRGDGICKYLSGNLCSIYEKRPLLCRVDASYDIFFHNLMEKDTYYQYNYGFCKEFRTF